MTEIKRQSCRDNIAATTAIMENYLILHFNKDHFGSYRLEEVIPAFEHADEDMVMHEVDHALDVLKDYPKMGELYFDILQAFYVKTMPLAKLKKEYDLSQTTLYRYRRQAIELVSELLEKEVFV